MSWQRKPENIQILTFPIKQPLFAIRAYGQKMSLLFTDESVIKSKEEIRVTNMKNSNILFLLRM